MALTKAQWYEKLKGFVPSWFLEEEEYQKAHLMGLAAVMEKLQLEVDNHVAQTFISQSEGEYLDAHGDERNIDRLTNELDAQYQLRVRNLNNTSNIPSIKSIVDKFLIIGESTIIEDYNSAFFFDREAFLNRSYIFFDEIYNAFSVIVEKQIHAPYSFVNRENFLDRSDYVGTTESSDYVFSLILEAVNKAKALGTLFRIIERME